MLDAELFGTEWSAHPAVSIALHAVNASLVFIVLGLMTGLRWRSTAVAAFFAFHPLRVESVAWLAETDRRGDRRIRQIDSIAARRRNNSLSAGHGISR